MILQDTEGSIARLAALRERGFSLALDDFGTGYSSLLYVRRFPADVLKVAKPFVDESPMAPTHPPSPAPSSSSAGTSA